MDPDFLAYLFNPIAPEKGIRYFLMTEDGSLSERTAAQLCEGKRPIVMYGVSTLIDAQRSAARGWIDRHIDIDTGLALLAGVPRRHGGAKIKRSFIASLEDIEAPEVRPYIDYCFKGERSESQELLLESVSFVATRLKTLWRRLVRELEEKGENRRFFDVEVPVSRILYRRQISGIPIRQEAVKLHLDGLGNVMGPARRRLRAEFGILDPENRMMVKRAIQQDSMLSRALENYENTWETGSLLKLYETRSSLAATLRSYTRSSRSRKILLRSGSLGQDRIFPDFDCMGTVTGRIIARNPFLQNLASEYRDVLCADPDKQLLYPDYKQCEPGILADDCRDGRFQTDYNSGDVYEALATVLFGSADQRNEAKLIFLFFCYGMAPRRIVQIASDITGLPITRVGIAIDGFFSQYSGIVEWRSELAQEVVKRGRVGTRLGNYRYFDSDTPEASALRWAQSQRIQGTAALILKMTMIEIDRSLPEVEMLLPMHDALLVQVPTEWNGEDRKRLSGMFCDAYESVCPDVKARVSFSQFAPTNIVAEERS